MEQLFFPLCQKRIWPAAVLLDDGIDFGHQADSFVQGNDNAMVVLNVVLREGTAFAVFKPFLADLVTADVEVPDALWYAIEEALRGIDPHSVAFVTDFDDLIVTLANELRHVFGWLNGRRIKQMKKPGKPTCREAGLHGKVPHDLRRSAAFTIPGLLLGLLAYEVLEFSCAKVAELVDAQDSGSCGVKPVGVRFPPFA